MSRVILDISMSLDGFVAASRMEPAEPMGQGGQRLHEWAFAGDDTDRAVLAQAGSGVGAVIAGRRTFDYSVPWWGADGPTGPARTPVIVVSHGVPSEVPEGGVYTFVAGGIEQAVAAARTAARGRDVCVMGGADLAQQFLRAGLLDELSIHLVPVLFGAGTRLFEQLGGAHRSFRTAEAIKTDAALHLRFVAEADPS